MGSRRGGQKAVKESFGFETTTEWRDVRIKFGVETTGTMPDGFEEAIAELVLPVKRRFKELIAKNVQFQAAMAEEEGFCCAIASQTYTTKGSRGARRGSCTVVVMLFIPAILDEERISNIESVLKTEIIEEEASPKLCPLFKKDSRDWRRANSYARRRKFAVIDYSLDPVDELDETTHEHVLADNERPKFLRLIA